MKNISDFVINLNCSIRDAIENIDSGKIGISFVVNSENVLIGTVSDGDIRRSMLKGISLEQGIETIINTNPIVGHLGVSDEEILRLYNERGISQLPIVDKKGVLLEIKTAREVIKKSDSKEKHENTVVLMVGGVGARLAPLTLETPKPMLNVGGKPILQTIVETFVRSGFYKFIFCVNHLSEQIVDYFGDGTKYGAQISYIHEEKKLGTAGALGLLKERLTSDLPFFVMNGDIITNVNFLHFLDYHNELKASASVCTREEKFQIPFGVIEVEEHLVAKIVEKPIQKYYVNAGIYILNNECLNYIEDNSVVDMPELLARIINARLSVTSFLLREDWIDIGRREEFAIAEKKYNEIFDK